MRSFKSRGNSRFNMLKETIIFEDLTDSAQGNCSRRERSQVFAEILNLCQKPQIKTHVMYQTNISHRMLQSCLLQLTELELLEVHNSKERYSTTVKGQDFLTKWKKLQELLQI
jgi:predicted transcriptional regulator